MENSDLVQGFQNKKVGALARLISLAENQDAAILPLLEKVWKPQPQGKLIGLSGPPGAGKSTLLQAWLSQILAAQQSAAVLAVDPVSPFTGGALLGDRLRLGEYFSNPNVYIRSLSSRGQLGGLSLATHQAAHLCLQYGYDWVFVETVGAGQNEVDVRWVADCVVIVLTPESGDQIQALKSGILEIADCILVNKADRGGAEALLQALQERFQFSGRALPLATCSAQEGDSQKKAWELVETVWKQVGKERRLENQKHLFAELLGSRLFPGVRQWIADQTTKEKGAIAQNPYRVALQTLAEPNLSFLRL